MKFQMYQNYLFPLIIILFFAYRMYRFKSIKMKIPKLLEEGAIIIDVRTKAEFSSGHNPLSTNIPLDQLESESAKLDKSKTILLCCASGARSAMALGILKKNGFTKLMNAGPWSNTLAKKND